MLEEKLFLWRSLIKLWGGGGCPAEALAEKFYKENFNMPISKFSMNRCPYCSSLLSSQNLSFYARNSNNVSREHKAFTHTCQFCGFSFSTEEFKGIYEGEASFSASTIRSFDINDNQVGLDELGAHLKNKNKDIYNISPRKFEELVGDIFRNLGYISTLTQQSRDGGYDLVLLENNQQDKIIVECKRYSPPNKVGVSIVRNLIGVQLLENTKKAKLVTSSYFTKAALDSSQKLNNRADGFELDLIDADRLLKYLDVYNLNLPPLEVIFNMKLAKSL